MLRFRRYRVFVFCAAVVLFLLFRVSRNSQWEGGPSSLYRGYVGPYAKSGAGSGPDKAAAQAGETRKKPYESHRDDADDDDADDDDDDEHYRPPAAKGPDAQTSRGPKLAKPTPDRGGKVDVMPPIETPMPPQGIPDRKPSQNHDMYQGPNNELHMMDPPGAKEESSLTATSTVYWEKFPEKFPVPEEYVIMLPTGSPKPVPRVQAKFAAESDAERKKREKRLDNVRGEMKRAWGGYRKFAWGHDELSPVSERFRDPFCGWAATLVDALDTLWIMGMHDEFDHAYAAVKQIDFTTSAYRSEIPVFETIIRYLGGLVAAYDVSGGKSGKYPALLDKAVELAEILMGVFDTPNRMPILYYNWKPAFASQTQRASSSVSVAELGSMSMEFTRLAQLTGKNKYYDAVARITDAFEEWQNRGTALPGIFPQQIDASGCNRTAQSLSSTYNGSDAVKEQAAEEPLPEPEGYKPDGTDDETEEEQQQLKKKEEPDLEFQITPGSRRDEPSTGEFRRIGKRGLDAGSEEDEDGSHHSSMSKYLKENIPEADRLPTHAPTYPVNLASDDDPSPFMAGGSYADWDCVAQNLTTGGYGQDQYGMGGSQDSAYEYFPKQYILLGGLVPKYRAMHEKVIEATKKYLLYRPMIKDDKRDILFSSKVFSREGTDADLTREYEITHLTCFLGGMFGLGGKLFDRPEDVEIAKKLADGCVWAYEIMPSGIMPEGSQIVPCDSVSHCPWNQTLWEEKLDPNYRMRDAQLDDYHNRMKEWKVHKQEILREHEEKVRVAKEEERQQHKRPPASKEPGPENPEAQDEPSKLGAGDFDYRQGRAYPKKQTSSGQGGSVVARPNPPTKGHRKTSKGASKGAASSNTVAKRDSDSAAPLTEAIDRKTAALEHELDLNSPGVSGGVAERDGDDGSFAGPRTGVPISRANDGSQVTLMEPVFPPEPLKPLTHDEYVAKRLRDEFLPEGFTVLGDRRYLLRPEAIESVWYMYRITGDKVWQEKGWRMYEAVMKACKTDIGHSAVAEVASPEGTTQLDEMESFWLAETLKYFYLLFTTPDVISLDDWVLNTEAHPFRRPDASKL